MKLLTKLSFFLLTAAPLCMAQNANDTAERRQAGQEFCPAIEADVQSVMQALREDMLVPGRRIDVAKVFASPTTQKMLRAEDERKAVDWANLCRYKRDNQLVREPGAQPKVVFIGDSITENWQQADSDYFAVTNINRGIGGQTSSQVLLRFYADVISLKPDAVHIMAGTNDIAEVSGKITDEDYRNNIRAMAELAKAHGIKVVIGSILPAARFDWNPKISPRERIIELNTWLKRFAADNGFVFADYYSALANAGGAIDPALSNDGIHPNRNAYKLMHEKAKLAIVQAIGKRETK